MNDFNQASGLITNVQTYDPRFQEAQDRQSLQDRLDRARAEHAKAEQDRKEAAFNADIAARTEVGLRGNQQLQAQRMGISKEPVRGVLEAAMAGEKPQQTGSQRAPQALVDALPVTVGGINIGPKEAQGMLARGEISKADYAAAVNAEVSRYGYSFK